MAIVDDFFISSNYVDGISEESYSNLDRLIDIVDSFARTTYQSIYIIDYFKKNFLYISDNPLFLCGLGAQDVKNLGYSFYINYVDFHLINNKRKILINHKLTPSVLTADGRI